MVKKGVGRWIEGGGGGDWGLLGKETIGGMLGMLGEGGREGEREGGEGREKGKGKGKLDSFFMITPSKSTILRCFNFDKIIISRLIRL